MAMAINTYFNGIPQVECQGDPHLLVQGGRNGNIPLPFSC